MHAFRTVMSRRADGRRRGFTALAFVAAMSGVSTPAMAQSADVAPPTIQSLSFAPTSIDVSNGPGNVAFSLHITDDKAGAVSVHVNLTNPSGSVTVFGILFRTAGTALDGTWTGNVQVPQYSASGVWKISNVSLSDAVGNFANISTAVLASNGFPTDITVASIPDTQAPVIAAVSITPSVMDVSSADQALTVDVQVTDDLSGAALTPCNGNGLFSTFTVILRSPSGAQNRYLWSSESNLITGNRLNGVWRGTIVMPRFSEAGTWRIQSLQAADCAGNFHSYNETQIAAANLQVLLNVASSPTDTQAPTLTALSYAPIAINTSTGNQLVTIQLGITDDLSGADFSPTTTTATFFEHGVEFRSPSGVQAHSTGFFAPTTLISGTPQNGVWQATINFQKFSEEGTWTVEFATIKDRTRNMRTLNTAALQAAGFPTTLEVIRPSLVSDGSVGSGGGAVSDQTFGDRAEVIFPPGAVSGTTQVAIDVLAKPLQIPNPTGFSGPGSLFVNIALTPEPAFPLAPPGLTVTLPLPMPMISGALMNLYKVDPASGQLVPELNVFGVPATGTVNADGLSATFLGVAGLSTVVGLIPEAINVAMDIKPGDGENAINLKSRGSLPVAILGTSSFDVHDIDVSFIRVAGAPVRMKPNGQPMISFEDVDGDGLLDLVVQIDITQLELTSSDTEAKLTARTKNGVSIIGHDSIRLVP